MRISQQRRDHRWAFRYLLACDHSVLYALRHIAVFESHDAGISGEAFEPDAETAFGTASGIARCARSNSVSRHGPTPRRPATHHGCFPERPERPGRARTLS